jgi:CRISPR system Cascade subunit CasA
MTENRFNLLTERLIGATAGGGVLERLTLPEVLATLARGEPREFAALQPYQFHAWHAFLVQLGAIAAFHAGLSEISEMDNADTWAKALRALTNGRDEPWCLIVPDLKAPAFMQPPVPEGSIAAWKDDNATATPDAIDLLATAKNHDVKMERIAAPRPEHWIYALVSLQTMEGYGGKMNYGIARMNGGYGNRPCFAAARDLAWPTRFVRDVNLLLEARGEIAANHSFDSESGCALLWLKSWDGVEQLATDGLDPFFIEICRRIRLIDDRGQIVAHQATTSKARISTAGQKKGFLGDLGDPWVPVEREKKGIKPVTATNLDYEKLTSWLFGPDCVPARASQPQISDGDAPIVICQLMVRGQGGTKGYHERYIPIPPEVQQLLATEDGRQQLGELSKKRIAVVSEVVNDCLRKALTALLLGRPPKRRETLPKDSPRIKGFFNSFDREVDRVFFAELFADVDLSFEAARLKWLKQLLEFAGQTLKQAKQSAPIPAARVLRARAAADRVFNGAAYRMRAAAGEVIENQGGTDEPKSD